MKNINKIITMILNPRLTREIRILHDDFDKKLFPNDILSITVDEGLKVEMILHGEKHIIEIVPSNDHPFKPPRIKFLTKIDHPNVDIMGDITLSILTWDWTPALQLSTIVQLIYNMISQGECEEVSRVD